MLKLAMDNPRRCYNVSKWKMDLTSYVQLSPGVESTTEMGVGPGNRRHGLFTFAVIKALESRSSVAKKIKPTSVKLSCSERNKSSSTFSQKYGLELSYIKKC